MGSEGGQVCNVTVVRHEEALIDGQFRPPVKCLNKLVVSNSHLYPHLCGFLSV